MSSNNYIRVTSNNSLQGTQSFDIYKNLEARIAEKESKNIALDFIQATRKEKDSKYSGMIKAISTYGYTLQDSDTQDHIDLWMSNHPEIKLLHNDYMTLNTMYYNIKLVSEGRDISEEEFTTIGTIGTSYYSLTAEDIVYHIKRAFPKKITMSVGIGKIIDNTSVGDLYSYVKALNIFGAVEDV